MIVAAHEVFHQKGYHEATMTDIAGLLGVTKPTIYHYFRGKEDLFAAVAEYERKILTDLIFEAFDTRDFLSGAEFFFDSIITSYLSKLTFESIALTSRDENVRKIIAEDREAFLAPIADFLRDRQTRGEVRNDVNPRLLACSLNALFQGLLVYILQGMEREKVKEAWIVSVRNLTQTSY